MKSNPSEAAPGNEFIILQDDRKHSDVYEVAGWSVERAAWIHKEGEPIRMRPTHSPPLDHLPKHRQEGLRGRWRFGVYARHLAIAGVAMLFVPSFLSNLADPREREAVAETIVSATEIGSQNAQTKGRPEDGSPASDRDGDRTRENRMKTVSANEISGARQAALQTSLDPVDAEIQTLKERVGAEATVRIEIAQASDDQNALEQERRRGDALARELALAREELEARKAAAKTADDAVQAAQALAIEHQQMGERERQLGEVLARQLASAQKAIETLMARVAAVTDARTEAERALQAAQASVAEQREALEQERRRGDTLARDLASAREEIEARKAAAKAADDAVQAAHALAIEHQQVGERERQLGEVLARQLASAQKEVETLMARIAAMSAARPEADQTLQAAQASAAHQRQALEQEQQRAAADTKGSVGKGDRTATPAREPHGAEIDDRTEVGVPPPRAIGEQIALWVKRGEDFVAAGDFVSARLVFQRAAETGDAKAALMLAETYDPNVLGASRAKGVAPDIAMARLWYEKAKALGSPEAQRRLERLDQPN
jgi:hypothetical protein